MKSGSAKMDYPDDVTPHQHEKDAHSRVCPGLILVIHLITGSRRQVLNKYRSLLFTNFWQISYNKIRNNISAWDFTQNFTLIGTALVELLKFDIFQYLRWKLLRKDPSIRLCPSQFLTPFSSLWKNQKQITKTHNSITGSYFYEKTRHVIQKSKKCL